MSETYENYSVGHPCFYKHGGPIPSLKAIQIKARVTALHEYREIKSNDLLIFTGGIDKAMALVDPMKKKAALLKEQEVIMTRLWNHDIPRFKAVRRQLSVWKKTGDNGPDQFSTPYLSMSLKHSHMHWNWRNLWIIKLLLDEDKQQDLFA